MDNPVSMQVNGVARKKIHLWSIFLDDDCFMLEWSFCVFGSQ